MTPHDYRLENPNPEEMADTAKRVREYKEKQEKRQSDLDRRLETPIAGNNTRDQSN
jgi:hypothetical protein